ncbi:MAG: hypothetical protein ABIZ56_06860 [Chthoniobacteraceae bacterium]
MANPTDKKTLIAELAAARGELRGYTTALRHDLDFGARLKRSVRSHPAVWFGGAAVLGLLLSRISPGRRKAAVPSSILRSPKTAQAGKAAFALTALKFAFDFARPALLRWIKERYMSPSRGARRPQNE